MTQPDPDGPAGPLTGPVTLYLYDAVGNLVAETDPEVATPGGFVHPVTTYVYDELDRLTVRRDPLGGLRQTAYDANGDVTETVDELGYATDYHYDGLSRLVETIQPQVDTPGGPA